MSGEKLIKKCIEVLKENEMKEFLRRSIKYILWKSEFIYVWVRPYTPSTGNIIYNSVSIGDKKIFDDLFPSFADNPQYEDGIVSCHGRVTRSGDSIVIVGGGNGVTAVHAARITGNSGKVTIYEGGEESVQSIRSVLESERVKDRCEVIHGVVGDSIDVYGGKTEKAESIPSTNLPNCDVLELDCEGGEVGILSNLDISPRAIIVELHPWLYPESNDKPIEILENLGYEIQSVFGHDGIEITRTESQRLLKKSLHKDQGVRGELESGAKGPVVVAAVLNESV